jgi:hypothetical protein
VDEVVDASDVVTDEIDSPQATREDISMLLDVMDWSESYPVSL